MEGKTDSDFRYPANDGNTVMYRLTSYIVKDKHTKNWYSIGVQPDWLHYGGSNYTMVGRTLKNILILKTDIAAYIPTAAVLKCSIQFYIEILFNSKTNKTIGRLFCISSCLN